MKHKNWTFTRFLCSLVLGILAPGAWIYTGGHGSLGFSPTTAFADTCTTTPGQPSSATLGASRTVTNDFTTRDVATNISFNTSHLGVGDICGGQVFYWTGLQGPSAGGSYCSHGLGFVQDGWSVWGDSGSQGPVYEFFDEYYDGTGNYGCGNHVIYYPTYSSNDLSGTHTYGVEAKSGAYSNGSCPVGMVTMTFDGTLMGDACVQWQGGNYFVNETERFGVQTHIGAIGYWYPAYCATSDGSPCSPSTAISWTSSDIDQEPSDYSYVDYNQYSPNHINTCDSRDAFTPTC